MIAYHAMVLFIVTFFVNIEKDAFYRKIVPTLHDFFFFGQSKRICSDFLSLFFTSSSLAMRPKFRYNGYTLKGNKEDSP